mmetsp:Transcript_4651/g.13434  ORF Transcript_4651/g.13434 Transcript_4651/m.13434 type:complete len:377 (-) Transcript_4651:3277-4407(-)
MDQSVFASETVHTQCQMLDCGATGLPMDWIAVRDGILQQWSHSVDVVLAHVADVLEHEAHGLQDAVLDVDLRHAVLVHQCGEHGEGTAGLGDDGNCDRGAYSHLAILHLQVVQKSVQDILRSDGPRDEAKRAHGSASDRLLVRLQHFQKFEADSHPLFGRYEFGTAIGDAAHEVDAVLLHLLVTIPEDGRESREEVADGRRHLRHSDDIDDGPQRPKDGSQNFRVLFTQVLVEHNAQVPHELVFVARLHHDGDSGDEVGSLHSNGSGLVVQTPLDGGSDLLQVRLAPFAQRHDDASETIQHDLAFLAESTAVGGGGVNGLLLKGVQDAIDQLLFKARIDVRGAQVVHHPAGGLHHHASVGLRIILEVLHDSADNVG